MRPIDADELIEKIRKLPNAGIKWFVSAEAVFNAILKAPTIEPQVRGKWERNPYSFIESYRCTCCGQKVLDNYWNFCPNCGADMRGRDDE